MKSTGRLNKQTNETMKITKKRNRNGTSYMLESASFDERVNLVSGRDSSGKYATLLIGCNGMTISRKEMARMLKRNRRIERGAA